MKKLTLLFAAIALLNSGCIVQPTTTLSLPHDSRSAEQQFDDAAISSKVKAVFVNNKLLGNKDLFVSSVRINTVNNVVYLSGTVDNEQQIKTAVTLAKDIRDVKQVISSLTVVK